MQLHAQVYVSLVHDTHLYYYAIRYCVYLQFYDLHHSHQVYTHTSLMYYCILENFYVALFSQIS